ncbi:RIP metalloprotease RseP [Abiotrophia defectiva]|uniref:RIP metalloprotease RseP n=1 Tax=Abiotrophia defectiva TaxID=46125 RepID=UPI0028D4AD1A|nr:RIP metalloprotease RseP [Abiotrophia defectiva]
MQALIVFLLVFTVIVSIHEFGHFYFARKAGILVREFAIGMGPKLFSHQGKDGVLYTIRMIPLGGYVRLAGLGEDQDAVQAGMQVGLVLNEAGLVTRINTSKVALEDEVPVQVDQLDLTDAMTITGLPLGSQDLVTYQVDHKARIIEADGSSIQVAPRQVTYGAAKPWAKFMTNVAGPMNNFILSILIFVVVAFVRPGGVPVEANVLGYIEPDSPAAQAGLQSGDRIDAIGETKVSNWRQMVQAIQSKPGQTVDFSVHRGDQDLTLPVAIRADQVEQATIGRIGVAQPETQDLWAKIAYGFTATWSQITGVAAAIVGIFLRGLNLNQFGGPVAIAQITSKAASEGFMPVLVLTGLLSANIGAFNLLPIPALDGGKIVLNAIEGVRGKPLSQEKEGILTIIGALILVAFMLAVTWNDISRLFPQ